jgi:hypothetical protein
MVVPPGDGFGGRRQRARCGVKARASGCSDDLEHHGGQRAAQATGIQVRQPPDDGRQEPGTEGAAHPGGIGHDVRGHRVDLQPRLSRPADFRTRGAGPVQDLFPRPTGTFLEQRRLVLVGEQEA